MREEKLKGAGGLNIFMRSWRPEGEAQGVVAMVPGFNSHSGYFKWVGEQLADSLHTPSISAVADNQMENIALAAFKGLSHLAPHAHLFKLKNEDFSRDPEVVQAMNNDPLIADETQPTQTVAEMVRADERIKEEFPLINLPLLILHGTADNATKFSGSQLFYDTAGSQDKTIKLYEGHFHDLLNVDKELVMEDIKSWIDARLPAVQNKSVPATMNASQM
jgi:alpha-beta hydrolase superfamily lysophospholipase